MRFSLTSGQSTNVHLPSFIAAVGEHTLICYSSSPNDSIGSSFYNGQSSTTFGIALGANLPVMEGFETSTCPSGILPNTNWSISHISTVNNAGHRTIKLTSQRRSKLTFDFASEYFPFILYKVIKKSINFYFILFSELCFTISF